MPRPWLTGATWPTTRKLPWRVLIVPLEFLLTPCSSIGGGGYGQNLAMWGSSSNPEAFGATGSVARAASNGWYNNELLDFPAGDYGKGSPDMSNFEKWGHYSQLVWAGSQKVGCATKFCPAGTLSGFGSWYTVCNYFPAGESPPSTTVSSLSC